MDLQKPIILPYRDDLIISIAGPTSEILSFLNLEMPGGAPDEPPFLLETVDDAGQWQFVEPIPAFSERLRQLWGELQSDAQPRGRQDESPDSEIWIPEGFDSFWSEVLTQLKEPTDTTDGAAPRGETTCPLSNDDVIKLLRHPPLSVQVESDAANISFTLPDKKLNCGERFFLAFNVGKILSVEVKAPPIDQIQVFIGPTRPPALTCSTNDIPLKGWKPASAGYSRCELPPQPVQYGVVLLNLDPKKSYTYSLRGACKT